MANSRQRTSLSAKAVENDEACTSSSNSIIGSCSILSRFASLQAVRASLNLAHCDKGLPTLLPCLFLLPRVVVGYESAQRMTVVRHSTKKTLAAVDTTFVTETPARLARHSIMGTWKRHRLTTAPEKDRVQSILVLFFCCYFVATAKTFIRNFIRKQNDGKHQKKDVSRICRFCCFEIRQTDTGLIRRDGPLKAEQTAHSKQERNAHTHTHARAHAHTEGKGRTRESKESQQTEHFFFWKAERKHGVKIQH